VQGSDNSGAIIFIDELDAVGTKRFDSELSGDREVQRTMLELLNQLDGFSSEDRIKVRTCAARLSPLRIFETVSTRSSLRQTAILPQCSCKHITPFGNDAVKTAFFVALPPRNWFCETGTASATSVPKLVTGRVSAVFPN
jgi:SpoVK/Ycf46/Vps4 family AAA+-type ATPase